MICTVIYKWGVDRNRKFLCRTARHTAWSNELIRLSSEKLFKHCQVSLRHKKINQSIKLDVW